MKPTVSYIRKEESKIYLLEIAEYFDPFYLSVLDSKRKAAELYTIQQWRGIFYFVVFLVVYQTFCWQSNCR